MDTRNTDIDRTHIIALQQVNGQFLNKELPISRPEHFIAELNAMIDNPNRTVWGEAGCLRLATVVVSVVST